MWHFCHTLRKILKKLSFSGFRFFPCTFWFCETLEKERFGMFLFLTSAVKGAVSKFIWDSQRWYWDIINTNLGNNCLYLGYQMKLQKLWMFMKNETTYISRGLVPKLKLKFIITRNIYACKHAWKLYVAKFIKALKLLKFFLNKKITSLCFVIGNNLLWMVFMELGLCYKFNRLIRLFNLKNLVNKDILIY